MTRPQSRQIARAVLKTVPLVMRTIAAEFRATGELSAPAHFGLLSILKDQPRTLTELASLQGVSLPTMSNSMSSMVQRGWVKRTAPLADRRVVILEVTPAGRAALDRVGQWAETHLAAVLLPLSSTAARRLQGGLGILQEVFAKAQAEQSAAPGLRRSRG